MKSFQLRRDEEGEKEETRKKEKKSTTYLMGSWAYHVSTDYQSLYFYVSFLVRVIEDVRESSFGRGITVR